MSDIRPPLPIPVIPEAAAAYVLATDVACVQCGYNLRSLSSDGRCPECNAPVAPSLKTNHLRFSHPAWIGKLELAVRLMLWGMIVAAVVGVLFRVLPRPLRQVLALANAALTLTATWLLTTPEPKARQSDNALTLREVVRVCAVLSATGTAATTIGRMNGLPYMGIAGTVLSLGRIPSTWLFCLYVRRLALRIPSAPLARSTTVVMWGLSISLGTMLVLELLLAGRRGAMNTALGVALIPVLIGIMIFGIWWIVLLFRYRKEFATAHREAAGNWQRAMAGVSAGPMSWPRVPKKAEPPTG